MSITLLKNQTADTVGTEPYITAGNNGFQSGLKIAGSLGGGTLTIEIEHNGDSALKPAFHDGTAVQLINSFAISDIYISQFSIPVGVGVRAQLTGATAPNLTVEIV